MWPAWYGVTHTHTHNVNAVRRAQRGAQEPDVSLLCSKCDRGAGIRSDMLTGLRPMRVCMQGSRPMDACKGTHLCVVPCSRHADPSVQPQHQELSHKQRQRSLALATCLGFFTLLHRLGRRLDLSWLLSDDWCGRRDRHGHWYRHNGRGRGCRRRRWRGGCHRDGCARCDGGGLDGLAWWWRGWWWRWLGCGGLFCWLGCVEGWQLGGFEVEFGSFE